MKKTVSYKQAQITDEYDVILVGSGPGALVTAAALAKKGSRCLLLERHYAPGGYTHVFKRKRYEWDVGVHYVGEVMRTDSLLSRLFRYVSDGTLEWADMGDVYDRIRFGDEIYDFVRGRRAWLERMKSYFPANEDVRALDQYMTLVTDASRQARGFFAEKAVPDVVSALAGKRMRRGFMKYGSRTTLDVLNEITANPKLIGVLTGQFGDYGLPPAQSSFAMHAMLVRHYFNGGAYPVGGSSRIFDAIAPTIIDAGGAIVTNAEVAQIMHRKGRVTGVLMADGRMLHAQTVISGAGVATTAHRLLDESAAHLTGLRSCVGKLENSAAHLCLYLGLNGTSADLNLPKANWWYYPENYDHDQNVERYLADRNAEFPVVYTSFPSAKDPSWNARFPERSTVELVTLAPFEWFQPWADKKWGKRGADYDAFKQTLTDRLLKKLFELEPQLQGALDHVELSTPLSTRHFCNYDQGEIYGLEHDPKRFATRELRPKTKLKGFYLTGQDVATAGIGGAMVGGVLCASSILKRNLLKDVLVA
ncbi:MAG: NAD(P)/FAD-dependent oxidoreductase [Myxococcota bacterium]|nr:NAD(P)/FAD-dependent oxidoreductase [Myxococcota bacterium]